MKLSLAPIFVFFSSVLACLSGTAAFGQSEAPSRVSAEGVREDGLLGQYGFVTDYRAQDEHVIRERIRRLVRDFNIKEFQFYDWFADYSTPTDGDCWKDAFFREREICRSTIRVMIDEIQHQGGRAWAYVQAVGAEEDDLADPERGIYRMLQSDGSWYWHAGRFPTYFANAALARRMVSVWADEIRDLGFDGIHWDTLGPLAANYQAEAAGMSEFLRTSKDLLDDKGLLQTMNFVDLAWWDESFFADGVVVFPYAEVWTQKEERRYYQYMDSDAMDGIVGVMPFYPSIAAPAGWTEEDVMFARVEEAARHDLVYLIVGDDGRRLTNEYFPGALQMPESVYRRLSNKMR